MDFKRIYILGAGSSIGHSKGLFPSITGFFEAAKKLGLGSQKEFNLIEEYAEKVLGKPLLRGKSQIDIESLFTHIEIEIEKKQSPDLLAIRQQLLNLIQSVLIGLEERIEGRQGEYHNFASKLQDNDTIITFNWDMLLDNVLMRDKILDVCYGGKGGELRGQYYQFMFRLSAWGEQTIDGISIRKPYSEWNPDIGYYLKMHGSIDWFFCSNESCRGWRKTFPLSHPSQAHYCSECHEPLESLLIPPVLNKEYRQYPIIRKIWNLAAKEISLTNELIIWGYSLPPTDFYSLWLLRQARESPIQRLSVINPNVTSKGRLRRRHQVLGVSFVRRFYDIFRDKLDKKSINLYESFQDYSDGRDISQKYNITTITL
jgi:hypothetical protein